MALAHGSLTVFRAVDQVDLPWWNAPIFSHPPCWVHHPCAGPCTVYQRMQSAAMDATGVTREPAGFLHGAFGMFADPRMMHSARLI